jgi:hypothetical protein
MSINKKSFFFYYLEKKMNDRIYELESELRQLKGRME